MSMVSRIRTALAATSLPIVAVLVAVLVASTSSAAASGKAGTTRAGLEHEVTGWVAQVRQLSSDVTASTTLGVNDSSLLAARVAAATSSLDRLRTRLETARPGTALRALRRAANADKKALSVLTSQVIEVIEADAVGAKLASLRGDERTLDAEVASLVGQPGHQLAASRLKDLRGLVSRAAAGIARVPGTLLAQVPGHFPENRKVFVRANRIVLRANLLLARAGYDESVIALAAGGYTGS